MLGVRLLCTAALLLHAARAQDTTWLKCPDDAPLVSVEGIEGAYCVVQSGVICSGLDSTGVCPGPQEGLPQGSHCTRVFSGVYGCRPVGLPEYHFDDQMTQVPTEPVAEAPSVAPTQAPTQVPLVLPSEPLPTEPPTPIPATDAPGTQAPAPPAAPAPETEAPVPVTDAPAPVTEAPASQDPTIGTPYVVELVECPENAPSISVEGLEGAYCIARPGVICSGSFATGLCPEPQVGLEHGSYCTKVRTGVYGCRPTNQEEDARFPRGYEQNLDTTICVDSTPVSVVGAGTFCVAEPVCSANILGNCPIAQSGLPHDAKCEQIPTGVYGCVAQ